MSDKGELFTLERSHGNPQALAKMKGLDLGHLSGFWKSDGPKAPVEVGHAKIAARLDGKSAASTSPQTRESRIETQRSVDAARAHRYELPESTRQAEPSIHVAAQRRADEARAIGRIVGKQPSRISQRLTGDGPKGAA